MKKFKHFIQPAFFSASLIFYSCGGGDGNTGNIVTEIDSTRDSTIILHHEHIPDPGEGPAFAPENAVKVELANSSTFNWDSFRNELSAREEAIGEGFRQEEQQVATAWEKFNDKYSYQTVYHYRDGELWLQTYYKSNNTTSSTDSLSNEEGQLLTKQGANNPELQDLWTKMEEMAANVLNQ
jgi:hypothetical protein